MICLNQTFTAESKSERRDSPGRPRARRHIVPPRRRSSESGAGGPIVTVTSRLTPASVSVSDALETLEPIPATTNPLGSESHRERGLQAFGSKSWEMKRTNSWLLFHASDESAPLSPQSGQTAFCRLGATGCHRLIH